MRADLDLVRVAEEYLASRRESFIYLLIDHAGFPELSSELSMSGVGRRSLFDGDGIRVPLSAVPVLVSVGDFSTIRTHTRLLRWIAKRGAFTSAVMMFASPESIDAVLKRLVARLDVVLSENTDALLRFYDARIFEALVKILSAEQAKNFLELASRWWYIDRTGKLLHIDSVFRADQERDTPLRLNATQEFLLIDATEPDRVLSLLRQNLPHLIASLPLTEQYRFTEKSICSAMEHGLRSTSDFVLYSACILTTGADFAIRPDWQSIFAKVRTGQSFAELVENNDDVALWDML